MAEGSFEIGRSGIPVWDDLLEQFPGFSLLLRKTSESVETMVTSAKEASMACRTASEYCEAAGWDETPWGDVRATPCGPLVSIGPGIEDAAEIGAWFDQLELELSRLGWHGQGSVLQLLAVDPSKQFDARSEASGAVLAFRLENPRFLEPKHQLDPYSLPRDPDGITSLVFDWVREASSTTMLLAGSSAIAYAGPELREYLLATVKNSELVSLYGFESDRFRECLVGRAGRVTIRGCNLGEDWHARVERLSRLLVHHARQLDFGAVHQPIDPWSPFTAKRHLWAEWIPAPAGVMLLNDAHMRKLPVLKNWIVKQVGHRRWLVQARDLHDWYADPQPDAKLLAQSRLDLSPALASDAIDTPDQGYPAVD